jgi:hypothetical protein
MRKLQLVGFILIGITLVIFIMWNVSISLPVWFIKLNDILMLISIIIIGFSKARISMKKR